MEFLRNRNVRVPLDVVAHSNGGLAARSFLSGSPNSASNIRTLVTYGTPHRGAAVNSLKAYANAIESGLSRSLAAALDAYADRLTESDGGRDATFNCNGSQITYETDFLTNLARQPLPQSITYVGIVGHWHPFVDIGLPSGGNLQFTPPVKEFRSEDCHSKHWDVLVPTSSADINLAFPSLGARILRTRQFHVGQPDDVTTILCGLDPDCVQIQVMSPVEITVVAPDGRSISKEFTAIPGAVFEEVEAEDEHSVDTVKIPFPIGGLYQIALTPKAGAAPTDTYSNQRDSR